MKKNLVKVLLAGSLVASSLVANDDNMNEESNTPSALNGIYVGGTIGGGSGSFTYETDTSSYSFENDGVSAADMKIYAGKRSIYLFIQTGTMSFDGGYPDLDYSAFGVGYLKKFQDYSMDLEVLRLTPQFDAEIAFDTATYEGGDMSGFLLSADIGLAASVSALPRLEFTADLGYDLHALKEDSADGTWNYGIVNFNVGVRYNF